MDSVTQENVEQILKEKAQCESDLAELLATTLERMWYRELETFEKEYGTYKTKREKIQAGGVGASVKKIAKKTVITKTSK
jgi:hypothetical protein